MVKFAVSAVFVCLFALLAPAVSDAAFVNYSGTLKGATAKFMTYNLGTGKLDMYSFKATDRGAPNIGVLFNLALDKGTMTRVGDTPLPAVAVFSNCAVSLLSTNLLPAGNGKYVGNCDVQIRFFTESAMYDPVTDTYSGSGNVYILSGGSEILAVADPARKKGLIKVNRVMPSTAAVLYVSNGSVTGSSPALVKSTSIPAFTLDEIPAP